MKLFLPTLEHTLRLGRVFARNLPASGPVPSILLFGELGAGKTTFVRGLVKDLPGGEEAEVASPSFNLANRYPTRPAVVHMDLYRLGDTGGPLDEELLEALESAESTGTLVLVEWAEYLPDDAVPESHLRLHLEHEAGARGVDIQAVGKSGENVLKTLSTALQRLIDS